MIATDRPTLSLAELDAYDRHPSGAGAEKRYCCPLPACRDKPVGGRWQSLCINTDSGAWLCNRCGATGKATERWEDRPPGAMQQIRRAQARARFALPPERQPGTAETAAVLPEQLARCVPVAGTPGHRYLIERGIGLGVATPAGVLYARGWYGPREAVVFPMRDRQGRVVAANGRYLTVPPGRTKTLCLGDRSLGVFATPGALAAPSGAPLVVVEGPMDALSLADCDVPAVAIVCTRAPHWLRTAAAFRRVLIGLDADANGEGDRASDTLAAELAPFAASVERLRPPGGVKDWNDALLADYASLCDFLGERIGR